MKTIQGWGVQLYDLFYAEEPPDQRQHTAYLPNAGSGGSGCLMSGSMPTAADEVAIDRMYADNNGLAPGDTLETEDGRHWTVSGLWPFRITAACSQTTTTVCLIPSNSAWAL